jgi:hypothetical protein
VLAGVDMAVEALNHGGQVHMMRNNPHHARQLLRSAAENSFTLTNCRSFDAVVNQGTSSCKATACTATRKKNLPGFWA